jgi:hypothetical protein
VRGKAGTPVEFGAKLSVSLRDGYVFLDRIDWNNFNESGDLKAQVELLKKLQECIQNQYTLIGFIEPAPIEPFVKKEGLESVDLLWEDHQPLSAMKRRSKPNKMKQFVMRLKGNLESPNVDLT